MRKTAAILFTVVLALFVMPLQLPAASCVFSKGPTQEACQSKCCANMICCAVSEKNKAPVSHPLYRSGVSKQLIGFASVAIFCSTVFTYVDKPIAVSAAMRAHTPAPLAATCIRLI